MMKRKFLNLTWALAACLCMFSACSDDGGNEPPPPPEKPAYYDYSCIIVNQGNYSNKDGSISYYRESDKKLVNNVFESVNGRKLAAIVESVAIHDTIALLMCNGTDKIELIDVRSAKVYTAPIEGEDVVTPRYAVVNGNYAYVSCWDKVVVVPGEFQDDYIFPNAYLLKINLKTLKIDKKIDCEDEAEGLFLDNGMLYVACNGSIDVFNPANDTRLKTISLGEKQVAKQFTKDKNGKIWCTVADNLNFSNDRLVVIDPTSQVIEQEIKVIGLQGQFCMNKTKDKVLFYTGGYDEDNGWAPLPTPIYTMDISSKEISENPVYDGEYIYGVGVNPISGLVYTAEVFGFEANSKLKVLSDQGTLTDEQSAGVGTCRFAFFNFED